MDKLQKIIEKLPPHIQDILYSDEYFAKFKGLSDSFGLNVEQSGILMEELVYVMAGLTHPDDFVHEIQKEVGLDKEQAEKITQEIDNKILKSIKADLIRIYNGEADIENPKSQSQNPKTTNDEVEGNINRDVLLSEIENPRSVQDSSMTEIPSSMAVDGDDIHNTPQEDLLKEVENPQPAQARGDLIGDKLQSTMTVPKKKVENDETKAEWKQPIDPYREAIE